jgi:hypothetical protein
VSEISRFFGIIVRMFANDHAPAHFHAIYAEFEVLIEIETLHIYGGKLPRREPALVLESATEHREDLRSNWKLTQAGKNPLPIEPLR